MSTNTKLLELALVLLIGLAPPLAQRVNTVDLTAPLNGPVKTITEIANEVLEFSRAQLLPLETPLPSRAQTLPLQLRLESLSAFDKDVATVVEVRLVNTGTDSLFLPISRERRALYRHPDDDKNREYIGWGLHLRSASSEMAFIGVFTYRSSTDLQEALEVRPNDPVLLRFQVDLDLTDQEAASRWMESLRRGDTVQAAVEIKRYVLKDFRPPEKGLQFKKYPLAPLLTTCLFRVSDAAPSPPSVSTARSLELRVRSLSRRRSIAPPGQEGWTRHQEKYREAPLMERTGWWFNFNKSF